MTSDQLFRKVIALIVFVGLAASAKHSTVAHTQPELDTSYRPSINTTDAMPEEASQRRHWEETEAETIWRDRYTNCDYGYYVLLPSGVIAHGSHSPNPNHGFLISLADVGRTSKASVDSEQRFLWVNAEYNVTDFKSLRGVANYQFDMATDGKANMRVVKRESTKLGGLSAIRFRFEYDGASGRVSEEEIVALRDGIVYEIGFRAGRPYCERDSQLFEQIRLHLSC